MENNSHWPSENYFSLADFPLADFLLADFPLADFPLADFPLATFSTGQVEINFHCTV